MAEPTLGSPKSTKESDVLIEMESQAAPDSSNEVNKGMHFRSGKAIHYVIAYERCEEDENKNAETMATATEMQKRRETFEKDLTGKGLEIELDRMPCPGVSVLI
jgi:hypothetical protein